MKVGLELHQQLATNYKLFCGCQASLGVTETEYKFIRRLRPTQSELGEVDPAALFEFKKGRYIVYEVDDASSCLVEMDEEPPHPLNEEAVEIALTVALMLNASPVDEIHVMRKIVIDGSNTAGFQRTALIASGGYVDVENKRVPIQTICIEEDAARLIKQEGEAIYYRLDRLGIPLIEIATAPVIESPKEALTVAYSIGRILRATGRVRRGLGSIRQDVNISVEGGGLIEVKGVQKLDLIEKVVEYEVMRQKNLLAIRDELQARGCKPIDIMNSPIVDLTEVFSSTSSRIIRNAIKSGGRVLGIVLKGFGGLLARELQPGLRFGGEFATRASFWGGVGGIFHTDELPAYGITAEEVAKVKSLSGADDLDAVVFVADKYSKAEMALKAIQERALEALKGVPDETRGPNPDGTTRYMRPRPGAARMYPETDIPPLRITEDLLLKVKRSLPEHPSIVLNNLVEVYGLNRKLAEQLIDSEYLNVFKSIMSVVKIPAKFVAATLTETLKSLEREGFDVSVLPDLTLMDVFKCVDRGFMVKENVPDVLKWLCLNVNMGVEDALKALNIRLLTREELEEVVDDAIEAKSDLVEKMGVKALDSIMGFLMGKLRGRVDPQLLMEVIRRKIEEKTGGGQS
ncbi:MAG: Glu-tRNA(Gln) amidotransferase subunit GatE [Candidatus Bathyarchaeia archaeon]